MSESSTADASQACPLAWPQQRWNLILFALCTGTQYLAAPVLYVGITQASLCNYLGADTRTANLPGTMYFAMTAVPALIAWLSPRVSALKLNMLLCYLVTALMLAALAVTLTLPVSRDFKLAMVVLQGAVSGAFMPAAIALLWEAVARGSDESRRGLALGLAFGVGPLLAVLGSLGQTALLGGDLFGIHFQGWNNPQTASATQIPWSFVILFGAGAPVMALTAVLSLFFVIPPVEQEVEREPVRSVVGLLIGLPLMFAAVALVHFSTHSTPPAAEANKVIVAGTPPVTEVAESRQTQFVMSTLGTLCGIGAAGAFVFHFRSLLRQRVLLLATLVTILVYAGNVIPSNMNLYTSVAIGGQPADHAGVQNILRFGFKVVAGILMGWMLVRTSPKAGVLVTSTIFLLSQIWAIFVTGPAYLIASGIQGAGELIGVYAPNYVVSASRRDQLRGNSAFFTMLMVPAAPAGYLYGAIVDGVKQSGWTLFGMSSAALGFRLSFVVCSAFILSGIILGAILLPAKPTPQSDRLASS